MLKTAEWVSPKHPDKMCDRISDAILDEYLSQDPNSRVAVETMGGHGKVYIVGEVTSKAIVGNYTIENIVKRITGEKYKLEINIKEQSPEISRGVDNGGAGDQGIMVGYACNENEEMIPQELYLARKLGKHIYKIYPYDGKTQITIDENGNVDTIVASFCKVKKEDLEKEVKNWIEENKINKGIWERKGIMFNKVDKDPKMFINPAGDWNIGGFDADTGLTGRKLAVDNYGTRVEIGGGAFSGKDATKVDRSGAYIARAFAVDLLKEYDAEEVIVKIAYSIGVARPVMVTAEIDGKEREIIVKDLEPKHIIDYLELRKPIFEKTATEGHFGNFNKWEK